MISVGIKLKSVCLIRAKKLKSVLRYSNNLSSNYNASGEISLSLLKSYPLTALTADDVSSPYSERVSIVSCKHHVST